MSCLSRPPSHCGSDGAVLTPPHHSPVCCHLSHQGTPQPPHLHTQPGLLLLLPSPLYFVAVCVCELVHLTLMTVFMSHPFLSPLSLTRARPSPYPLPSSSQLTPLLPTILQHNKGFPLLSTRPLGATHSFCP